MKELKVIDLYEKNSGHSEDFFNQTNSTLRVQKDYEQVIENLEWLEMMELTIPYLDNIFRNPNRFIVNEEEIVKIELARRITVESIKHLSKNTNFIQDYDKVTGDVRPSKILNINKEENYDTYENRFIYTLIQNMKFFISKKEKEIELTQNISEKNNKQFDYNATSKVLNEKVDINLQINTKLEEENKKKEKGVDLQERIKTLKDRIADVCSSEVYKIIEKKHITLVVSPIKKTNIILKNVNFQYAIKLWNFLQTNLDVTSKHIQEKQDYMDKTNLKELLDETFLLQYLALNTIEDDKLENEEKEQKMTEQTTNQMIEQIINLNGDLSEEQFKDLVASKYAIIKYKHVATINELQKIFKKHIEKYMEKIK
ncbi:MAG: DUF2357 domain-containing protein [Clostridia bacterium]|nr:DUF2357 domain-containing protein [Clostridia bacterium]